MNRTWSIILIVVASIVVLGGTYWYFGMQKPRPQGEPTPIEVAQPAAPTPSVAKGKAAVATRAEEKPAVAESKQSPAESDKASEESNPMPQKDEKVKALPAPLAPAVTRAGGFSLPSLGPKSEEEQGAKKPTTSVLISEALPTKIEIPTPMTKEDEDKGPEAAEEDRALPRIEDVVIEASASIGSEPPEESETEGLPPVAEPPIEAIPTVAGQPVGTTPPVAEQPVVAKEVPTPPINTIFRSETSALDKDPADEGKATLEGSISVSFLEYNFPKEFNATEKGFTVSVDLMRQHETFGWGGTLEVGKNTTTDQVEISLLGKTEWKLGKGVVTFPLSISLGPALFIDSTTNTPEFGMKAKLGAGVTYAISESFRFFYAVGVGSTFSFQDKSSFRLVLEPIRIGVGFSF